jgi:hypothetical protein
MLVNSMSIRSNLLPFRVFYLHLPYFVVILVYFSRFGKLFKEKSGKPACVCSYSCGRTTKTFEGGADNGKETFEEKRSCTYGAASKARVTRLGEFSPDG